MYKIQMSRFVAAAMFLALGASGVRAAEFTEEYLKTFPLTGGAPVRVENVNGKVEVLSWDEDFAEVRAVKRTRKSREELSRVSIEASTTDGLRIRTNIRTGKEEDDSLFSRMFGGVGTSPQVDVNYTIRVPRTARLEQARTVNGSVILRNTRGNTVATATNGTISAEGAERVEKASTTNGNISITGGGVSVASTTNGSISVTLTAADPGDMDISTTNGSVSITLPSSVNVGVELRTVNGRVSVPGGLTLNQGVISPRKISGRLGSGGNTISAGTVNGSVSLNIAGSE